MSIVEGLKNTVAAHPDKLASIATEARYTFKQLDERINRLSGALADLGIQRGDRVAILALNHSRYLELYYGVPQIGAAVVPINFRIPPAEVQYIIEHSEAVALVVDDALAPLIDALRPQLATVKHFISIGEAQREDYLMYEALLSNHSPDFHAPEISDDELLGLFYTSGTTAQPKGVMLTHDNMLSNIRHSNTVAVPLPDDVFLHTAPMFHLADGAAVFNNIAHGVAQAYLSRFDPTEVLETIQRERISTIVLVPTMINFLLQHPRIEEYDLSSLRHLTYGASPIAPETLRRAMKVFGCRFGQGYGLTEASPLLTVLLPEDHQAALEDQQAEKRLASCGRPVQGVEVRVVKDDGTQVSPGEVGEIIARGPNIMKGYWKRPQDTANTVRAGWLYTGDLATVDEEGYLYLVDRKKDMIVSGGENVFSTEVEAVIYMHPAVKEAAVIPVPDAEWGERVHACVSIKDGATLTLAELEEFCRPHLPSYKIPRSIEVIAGELPKGGTGKILKKTLREKYWQGKTRLIG
ncbi:MAG: long-chain-fatty-acid--CoA ligase [Acidobacteria bacterium]|nr:long-chain-fatty-acid--CoA ligase [Acidobacteriota bacterium]